MTDPIDGSPSVTIKYGTAYDAAWFVARGTTAQIGDQLIETFGLEPAPDATLNDLILAATAAAHGSYAALKGLPSAPNTVDRATVAQAPAPAAPPQQRSWGNRGGGQAAAPQGAPAPTCNHGEKVLRSGNYKSGPRQGQAWSAWMCPSPKGTPDQCSPVDAVTGKEWN